MLKEALDNHTVAAGACYTGVLSAAVLAVPLPLPLLGVSAILPLCVFHAFILTTAELYCQ